MCDLDFDSETLCFNRLLQNYWEMKPLLLELKSSDVFELYQGFENDA